MECNSGATFQQADTRPNATRKSLDYPRALLILFLVQNDIKTFRTNIGDNIDRLIGKPAYAPQHSRLWPSWAVVPLTLSLWDIIECQIWELQISIYNW
ncbi:hypothetical protein TNCV_4074021 [Trichonephila clavipes]|uniref:Uncharacterized protein n=1 Tax=Trichonephila clavipes TaxID=2585209 RepID=A0A8X6W902_TRICX|nr:hypothetical protein TNCV_4074021 [Trichonephila clavipes]